jgi:hypothetical protein
MIDIKDLKDQVDDWMGHWEIAKKHGFISYSYQDTVDLVCDSIRSGIRKEYDEYNLDGVVEHNGRLSQMVRELEGARALLKK